VIMLRRLLSPVACPSLQRSTGADRSSPSPSLVLVQLCHCSRTAPCSAHCAASGTVKHGVASYEYLDDLLILSLHVDDESDQSDLPEGVTSHTQTVILLLPEAISGKEFVSGARVKVSCSG
jgi:hypothetical protein